MSKRVNYLQRACGREASVMRNFAIKTRRMGTWQFMATLSGMVLVMFAVTTAPVSASPLPSATDEALAALGAGSGPARIQAIDVKDGVSSTQIEVATDGAPIWTTYRNSDGDLVIELPNSTPAESLSGLSSSTGLLQVVDVEVQEGSDHPSIRLVIKTRDNAEHSIVAEGTSLNITLVPIGSGESGAWAVAAAEPETQPVVQETATAPASVTEPIPGPSGQPAGEVVARQLEGVEVETSGSETQVRIVGNGEFYYSTLTLRAPDRFVVDLEGVVNEAPSSSIAVENDLVERVRIAQYKPYPEPISRVVVDLRGATETHVETGSDGLTISFSSEGTPVAEVVEQAPVVEEPIEEEVEVEETVATIDEPIVEEAVNDEVAPEVEEVAAWQTAEAEEMPQEGMGADETGTVGSHELSSLATAVATDSLEEAVEAPAVEEPAIEETVYEESVNDEMVFDDADHWDPEPVAEIAEARPDPEPMAFSAQDNMDAPPAATAAPPTFESQSIGASTQTYEGEAMTMSLKDADIKDVLRSFAQISGLNVVVQPGVTGTVTVELTNVPWDQALEQILKINGLGYELEGNIMRVAPRSQLILEAEEAQRQAAAKALSIPLSTMMKRVSYAAAGEVAGILKAGGGASIMSQRGSVVVDSRTNTLIIKELPSFMDTVLAVIQNLDVPEPQVMIEARIIETTKRFVSTLGIQWGFEGLFGPEYGNSTGLQFPNNGEVDGSVNLLTGANNGLLGITLGNVLDTFTLDITLQAAENEGLINILSAPKITTLNNEQASIQSGLQIPIQTVANNTVSVQFVNATLRLDVTPHVTAEGTVLMDISIQKREPQLAFAVVGATNAPIATKDARTRVIVRDGGTTVIGGIYEVSTDRGEDRVPGLANIPVLGHLFRNKRQNDENEELLIFITPRVIKL